MKVLKQVAKDPDCILDENLIKGLVTKIYKRAKKKNKAAALIQKIEMVNASNTLIKTQKKILEQDKLKQYNRNIQEATLLVKEYLSPGSTANKEDEPKQNQELEFLNYKKCYICKVPYRKVHHFYHALCPECSEYNVEKRIQKSNLQGRVALVTGGRIKIGHLTALKLLRDGATVWVTTRFPNDCAKRFSQEPDFLEWKDRLNIYSLDLLDLKSIQLFIQYLQEMEPHLDILINNAAQTIKRPKEFYEHLRSFEEKPMIDLPDSLQGLIRSQIKPSKFLPQLSPIGKNDYFPLGQFDKDHQQVDLRTENSWTALLNEVSPVEFLETQLINVTAPFMLNSGLKAMMIKSPFERKFIVNVSAMEGQFNRISKTPFHPHTNMAKASLNMMTRTSAQEYALSNIFMNSVDTGWITQENPFPKKERLIFEEGFIPPLDETDGMARIYDPIATGINKEEIPLFGHFLKDYKPYFW
jgi:NAD(P)-dependent dehydrogenase (short-subunit alcohol dehydrogenase family)